MKQAVRILALALSFCLLATLLGCSEPTDTPTDTRTPTPQSLALQESEGRLEVDGKAVGAIYTFEETPYFAVKDLDAVWSLRSAEQDETLMLSVGAESISLRHGASVAQTAEETRISLGAPVLHASDGWYLPVKALELLWGRKLISDGALQRALHLEDGPALSFNGTALERCILCNGVPAVTAAQLAALTDSAKTAKQDGILRLTLRAGDRTLVFLAGKDSAALDGEQIALPIPAWRNGEDWMLPVQATAEALGCTVSADGEAMALLKAEVGTPFWFAGTGFAQTLRIEDTVCCALSELAQALGGSLKPENDGVTLKAPAHSVVFRRGKRTAEADGQTVELPCPAIDADGAWIVPLEPLAEVFGLTRLEDEENRPVYSRMEAKETTVYLNGLETQTYTLPEGGLYVSLDALSRALGGSLVKSVNEATLNVQGKEVTLHGGSATVVEDGAERTLELPVAADGAMWYAPTELLPAFGLTELKDPDLDQIYYTHIVRHDDLAPGYRVPVLMYHAVSDTLWGVPELFVSPSQLDKQLQAMLDAGYTPITFEDLDHVAEIQKPVLMTFDDGYDDNYSQLFPLLKKYNVKATIFVIAGKVGMQYYLTREQIREMSDSGLVSIQSHTMTHGNLDEMYENELHKEHRDSLYALARMTGKQPFVLCYPSGRSTGTSREITAQYYEYGLLMGGPCYVTGEAPYRICRIYVPRYLTVDELLSRLRNAG